MRNIDLECVQLSNILRNTAQNHSYLSLPAVSRIPTCCFTNRLPGYVLVAVWSENPIEKYVECTVLTEIRRGHKGNMDVG